MSAPWLSVVVPAYNEEAGLETSVTRLVERLSQLQVASEILIVDDCSTDHTEEIADSLAERFGPGGPITVRTFHHAVNHGIGGGLKTGIAEARGEWLILIPADLALDLTDLGKFLEVAPGADIVVGVRSDRSDYSAVRRLVSAANIELIHVLFRMRLHEFQYICMYRLAVLDSLDICYWHSAFFHAEILIKARDLGWRMVEVTIRYAPRSSGHATGASWSLITRTGRDMLRYWMQWALQRLRRPGPAEPPPQSARADEREMEPSHGSR